MGRGPLKAVLVLGLVGLLAFFFIRLRGQPTAPSAGVGREGGGPVAVVTSLVAQEDVPTYLQGVGTVQAYQTVTVRSRVDGQLLRIAFHEGEDVKAGDLLALIDARPFEAALAQAEAKTAQDEAALTNARKDLARYQILVDKKLQQPQTLDTQQATVRQFEAAVRGDKASADSARVQLSYTRIVAPISGRTGIRGVDTGNIIHSTDASGIVMLVQLEPIAVLFTVPEKNVEAVNAQQKREPLALVAQSADGQTVLDEGKLLLVDNQIDTTTGTAKLKAILPNAARKLWPGQFVNVRMLLTTQKDATVIPSASVQRGPQGTFVYVVGLNQTAQMRPVTLGQIQFGKAVVESGLLPGERVVVDGQYKLQPGSHVVTSPKGTERGPAGALHGRSSVAGERP